jgi:hypothetical protein
MAACAFLPGITFSWRHPVLVDPLGMASVLGSALLSADLLAGRASSSFCSPVATA